MTDALVPHHREITLGPGVILTPTGAVISEDVSLKDWGTALVECQSMANATMWSLGDLLLYAQNHDEWGERYTQFLDMTNKSYSSLTKAAYIARQFPKAERVEGVSWTHHREVVSMKDKQDRSDLLHRAKEEEWTREQLRDHITGTDEQLDVPPAHTCPKCGHQWS